MPTIVGLPTIRRGLSAHRILIPTGIGFALHAGLRVPYAMLECHNGI